MLVQYNMVIKLASVHFLRCLLKKEGTLLVSLPHVLAVSQTLFARMCFFEAVRPRKRSKHHAH